MWLMRAPARAKGQDPGTPSPAASSPLPFSGRLAAEPRGLLHSKQCSGGQNNRYGDPSTPGPAGEFSEMRWLSGTKRFISLQADN